MSELINRIEVRIKRETSTAMEIKFEKLFKHLIDVLGDDRNAASRFYHAGFEEIEKNARSIEGCNFRTTAHVNEFDKRFREFMDKIKSVESYFGRDDENESTL